jgi:hypothetical protein
MMTPDQALAVNEAKSSLVQRVSRSHEEISGFLGELTGCLDSAPRARHGYRLLCEPYMQSWKRWSAGLDEQQIDASLHLHLLDQIDHLERRLQLNDIPQALSHQYGKSIDRLVRQAGVTRHWKGGVDGDLFHKDLAILLGNLVPCVSHVIYRNSGVPRRSLLRPRNLFSPSVWRLLIAEGGTLAPFLENHVHPGMLDQFDEAGRAECFRIVALLLEHWGESRGLMGTSWYYDEAVASVSPRLAYLRQVPERYGAIFLDAGTGSDAIQSAISTSRHRRSLYEARVYKPRNATMVWCRRDILDSPFASRGTH